MTNPPSPASSDQREAVARAADAILKDIRDRRLLKWIFADDPDSSGPIGWIDRPIDVETQRECAEKWASLAFAALLDQRQPNVAAEVTTR